MRLSSPVRMRGLIASATLLLPLGSLAAQTGSPKPVLSDTIYKLAVDSTAYKQYPFVYLLDDGIIRAESDGRGTERYHQIVQILKPAGVEQWAERRFGYRPGHTKLTVNWMRVVKPSGEMISDKPNVSQESTVPAAMSDPVYSDAKVLRYSLSGVAVGTIVDISWTTETTDPFLKGDFLHSWRTTMEYPAIRSRYVLDVPAAITPHIVESHVDFKRVEQTSGGRHTYEWAKQNSLPVKGELFAPDSTVPRIGITVGSAMHWSDVARWYAGLAKDRYVLSPSTVAKIDSIARAQHSASDTVQALHRWIARDIRYVSVAFGLGGYQPRLPDSTVATGLGDCKDKATLFIAAARHLGLTAYPVLLNSNGIRRPDLVSITEFDHVIAAMPQKGSKDYSYLDLTTDAMPVGILPPSYQGEFGLVVLPDGKSEEITFPEDAPSGMTSTFDGEVDATGKVSGRLTYLAAGSAETGMRLAFLDPMDSTRRAQMEKALGRLFPSGTTDSMTVFNARDPHVEARITTTMHGGEAFKRTGSVAILSVPSEFRGPASRLAYMLGQLPADDKRTLPIDAAAVVGPGTTVSDIHLTLPEGWKAQLPKNVNASSVFGSYRAEYSQDGRVLHIYHSVTGSKGVFSKDRIAELKAWMKAAGDDDVDSIALISSPVP